VPVEIQSAGAFQSWDQCRKRERDARVGHALAPQYVGRRRPVHPRLPGIAKSSNHFFDVLPCPVPIRSRSAPSKRRVFRRETSVDRAANPAAPPIAVARSGARPI
jgi:hypothetical protein